MTLYIFLQTVCRNSDMLRSILIIYRVLLNISKAYVNTGGSLNTLTAVHKMTAGVIKFVCSSAELVHKR
jgi:hypothetical protein